MSKFQVTQDWENDGILSYSNAQTLDHYCDLKKAMNEHRHPEVEFAFGKEQFDKMLSILKPKLKEGEKIIAFGSGGFATPYGYNQLVKFYDEMNERIKNECDPQEVYVYQYNNYECCIAYEGDTHAIKYVLDIFGEEKCRTIKRYRVQMTIDQLLLNEVEVQGLTFNGEQIPEDVWFDEAGDAFTAYDCKLYKVYLNQEQFRAQNEHWKGLTALYKKGKLYEWHKE